MAGLDNTNNEAQQGRTWGSRFARQPTEAVRAFTASIETDVALYRQDIAGSRAHVRMLAAQAIIPHSECAALLQGLDQVEQEIAAGALELSDEREDIHTHVEARLAEIIGEAAAGWLHTGRSRNDQVALDTRLYTRDAIDDAIDGISALQTALVGLAERNLDTYLPGYTHLQRAQPLLLAHHLLAYYDMLDRDAERLQECRQRINVLPLGAGALAGTSLPIDRAYVARLLGFARVSTNSLDTVADRDFVVEFLSVSAMISMHLSRFAEELVLWASSEFQFIELPDAFATGSSMMPQKKNPDVPEIIRGKTGRVYGNLFALLTTLKGLPLAYNRDLQEDKEPLFDTVDTVKSMLSVLEAMLGQLVFRPDRMQAAALGGFTLATDVADYLVEKGVPFRKAHDIVARVVRRCLSDDIGLEQLSLEDWQGFSSAFESDLLPRLSLEAAVDRRRSAGGTARANVHKRLQEIGV